MPLVPHNQSLRWKNSLDLRAPGQRSQQGKKPVSKQKQHLGQGGSEGKDVCCHVYRPEFGPSYMVEGGPALRNCLLMSTGISVLARVHVCTHAHKINE